MANDTLDQRQKKTPFFTAMWNYVQSNPAPFDVPGHKMGNYHTDLSDFAGSMIYKLDINAPLGLDNLYHSTGVIKESEELCAECFHAEKCLFSVNGTSGGILTMLVGILKQNDKIILPRNVHKSIINGLILSGAVPIFVTPDYDLETGIANGVPFENYKKAIDEHLEAKAVFVINPTYFGIASDLVKIVNYAHEHDMIVIADEAHGSHLYFSDKLPMAAMDAGADCSALSLHKTAGSLTQSSIILYNTKRIDEFALKKAFAMFSSTSPNHLLLASIDVTRKKLYFEGEKLMDEVLYLSKYARTKLHQIKGIKVYDKSYCTKDGRNDIDLTKLMIKVTGLGLSGFEVYRMLKNEFNVQLELAEVGLVLCIISLGSTKEHIDRLVEGLKTLSARYYAIKKSKNVPKFKYSQPPLLCTPNQAFHAPKKLVDLKDSIGEICSESLMVYPPGIPLAIPGEMITSQAVSLIEFYQNQGGVLLSDSPEGKVLVIDRNEWYLESEINYDY